MTLLSSADKAKKIIAEITSKYYITEPTIVDGSLVSPNVKEIANAVTTRYDLLQQSYRNIGGVVVEPVENGYAVRKHTPKEVWRLMGISDGDFIKADSIISDAQLYKQAGNAIVVPLLESIFKNLIQTEKG